MKNFMKNFLPFAILCFLFIIAKPAESQETLYKRLGGYDAIAAVSDDFIGRLAADTQLNKFLIGLNSDSKKLLR